MLLYAVTMTSDGQEVRNSKTRQRVARWRLEAVRIAARATIQWREGVGPATWTDLKRPSVCYVLHVLCSGRLQKLVQAKGRTHGRRSDRLQCQ